MTKGDEMSSCGLGDRVIRRVGPLNYEVVLEDLCIVNMVMRRWTENSGKKYSK